MDAATDALSAVLIGGGALFVLLASVGLHRFDDLYSRIHSTTKATTLGLLLAALGAALQVAGTGNVTKLLLACVLQLVSAPVAAHMVGRAAYLRGAEPSPGTVLDQLAEDRAAADEAAGDGPGDGDDPLVDPPPIGSGPNEVPPGDRGGPPEAG